jgi:hypothetical protein
MPPLSCHRPDPMSDRAAASPSSRFAELDALVADLLLAPPGPEATLQALLTPARSGATLRRLTSDPALPDWVVAELWRLAVSSFDRGTEAGADDGTGDDPEAFRPALVVARALATHAAMPTTCLVVAAQRWDAWDGGDALALLAVGGMTAQARAGRLDPVDLEPLIHHPLEPLRTFSRTLRLIVAGTAGR